MVKPADKIWSWQVYPTPVSSNLVLSRDWGCQSQTVSQIREISCPYNNYKIKYLPSSKLFGVFFNPVALEFFFTPFAYKSSSIFPDIISAWGYLLSMVHRFWISFQTFICGKFYILEGSYKQWMRYFEEVVFAVILNLCLSSDLWRYSFSPRWQSAFSCLFLPTELAVPHNTPLQLLSTGVRFTS